MQTFLLGMYFLRVYGNILTYSPLSSTLSYDCLYSLRDILRSTLSFASWSKSFKSVTPIHSSDFHISVDLAQWYVARREQFFGHGHVVLSHHHGEGLQEANSSMSNKSNDNLLRRTAQIEIKFCDCIEKWY